MVKYIFVVRNQIQGLTGGGRGAGGGAGGRGGNSRAEEPSIQRRRSSKVKRPKVETNKDKT